MVDIELAAAIVIHKGCILIVRRSDTEKLAPGVWGVPCGKLDKNESASEAVLRELQEETGLCGEIVRPAGNRIFRSEWHGRRITNVQRNYVVQPEVDPADTDASDMPHVRLPKTDQASMWVPAGEIDSINGLDEHNLETIRQGLAVLKADSRT
jgi:8-oxo-dGTP diphosphatase